MSVSRDMGLLRLFLAVSVLVTHLRYGRGILGLSFLNGALAVQTFFIISGFYMALVLNEKYNYLGSYWHFIQQRFLRLYPLYLFVGVLILAVEGLITYATSRPCGVYEVWVKDEPHCITLFTGCYYALANLMILGLDTLWFLQQDSVTGQLYFTPYPVAHATQCFAYILNGPTWTLAVEMTFYLLAPFLVRKPVPVQAAFMLASLALRSYFFWTLSPKLSVPWTYYFSPSDLCFFMAGSLGYHFYSRNRAGFEQFARSYAWLFWLLGAVMLVQGRLPFKDYFFYVYVPAAMVMVPLLFACTRNNKRDRLIGELSYPFYLIHLHVVWVTEYFLHEKFNAVFGPFCLLVSLSLAYLMFQWIEIRTERFREKLFQHHHG